MNLGIVGNDVPPEFAEALESRLEANWKSMEQMRKLHANVYATVVAEKSQGPWLRSTLTILGKSGAGKNATLRSLLSEPFVEDLAHEPFQVIAVSQWLRSHVAQRGHKQSSTLTSELAFRLTAKKLAKLEKSTKKRSSRAMTLKLKKYKAKVMPPEEELDDFERRMLAGGAERGTFQAISLSCLLLDHSEQPAHSVLLAPLGVYLLVFDAREGMVARTQVEQIALRNSSAPIYLVATHSGEADIPQLEKDVQGLIESMSNVPLYFHAIDNSSKSGVKKLRDDVSKKLTTLKETATSVNVQWTQCLDQLFTRPSPYIGLDIVKDCCTIVEAKEIARLLTLTSDVGLLYYTGATQCLSERVVLDRKWLLESLDKLNRRNSFNADKLKAAGLSEDHAQLLTSGIASRDLLHFILGNDPAPYLLELAKHNLLISELRDEQYVLPQFVSATDMPTLAKSGLHASAMHIRFSQGFIPFGLFERLLTDVVHTQQATVAEMKRGRWTVEVGGFVLCCEKDDEAFEVAFRLDERCTSGRKWVQVLNSIMTKLNSQVWRGRLAFTLDFMTSTGTTLNFNSAKREQLAPWFH